MAVIGAKAIARSLPLLLKRGPEAVAPASKSIASMVSRARLPNFETHHGTLQLSLPHNIWSEHSFNGVQLAYMRPGSFADGAAFHATQAATCMSGLGRSSENMWLRRLLLLSAMAAAPGRALAGMATPSLKGNRWLQGLLKEAPKEQARMDILLHLRAPGPLSRMLLAGTQATLGHGFLIAHQVSPSFCHWFSGYVEEESIKAYAKVIEEIDADRLQSFAKAEAPAAAREQYGLPEGAPLREVFKCILAEGMLSC